MPELPTYNQQRAQDLPRSYHWKILIITTVIIGLSFLNWGCYHPSSKYYGYCFPKSNPDPENKDDGFGWFLILAELGFFIMYWIDCKKCVSRAYLKNDMEIPEYEDYLKEIKSSLPQIGTKVECFHYEQSRDDEVKKVTYTGTSYWNYKSCNDVTGQILGMNQGKMIKLEVMKSYTFGSDASRQEYENFSKDYVTYNQQRDKQIQSFPIFEIGGLEPHILVQNKNTERHFCMSDFWYWFWSFLLLSWLYRMWLEFVTVNKRIEIKKVVYGCKDQETIL